MVDIDPGSYDMNEDVHKITDYRCISSEMQHISLEPRLYLHLDMNCYYAQLEQLCYNLYGMPVYIGGWYKPDGTARGIVATSSYEARSLGIKTGMSAFEAEQICPYLIGLQADYEKYKGTSHLIKDILKDFAMDVEKYSMDEYFLDINFLKDSPRQEIKHYVQELKNRLYQKLHLVCSIGVARSKTYSKLASDLQKPNGLNIILDKEDEANLIHPLALDEIWGIGRQRFKKLKNRGIYTIADALEREYQPFQKLFGTYFGKLMYEMVAGQDRGRVLVDEQVTPDQLDYMHTFSNWTKSPHRVVGEIMKGIQQICYRMRGYNVRTHQYFCYLRVQSQSWSGVKFCFNTDGKTNLDDYVFYECMKLARPHIKRLLENNFALRGIGIGTLTLDHSKQMDLFFQEQDKMRRFYLAQDAINNRYGKGKIQKASVKYAVQGKTHFLGRS